MSTNNEDDIQQNSRLKFSSKYQGRYMYKPKNLAQFLHEKTSDIYIGYELLTFDITMGINAIK